MRWIDKDPADGPSWPTVAPEEIRCYENDILPHKETVFSWLHVRRRASPSLRCSQSHTLAHAQLFFCLDLITELLSLPAYSFFHNGFVSAPSRIFAYLPYSSHIFVTEFWEMESPHIDTQCSLLIWCQRLWVFRYLLHSSLELHLWHCRL